MHKRSYDFLTRSENKIQKISYPPAASTETVVSVAKGTS